MQGEDLIVANTPKYVIGGGRKRLLYVDAMKGFACLCVVLGHVIRGYLTAGMFPELTVGFRYINDIVYAFHMPLFMMISGFLYRTAYFEEDGQVKKSQIRRQIGNLLLIYLIYSVWFGIFQIVFSKFANRQGNLLDIFMIWCKPIAPYWYLYNLVVFYLLFMNMRFCKKQWTIGLFLLIASLLGTMLQITLFDVSHIMFYAFFFYMGILKVQHPHLFCNHGKFVYGTFVVAVLLMFAFCPLYAVYGEDSFYLLSLPFVNVFIGAAISLGVWFSFQYKSLLGQNRFLMFIGRYSLEIFVLHSVFTAGFRTVLPRVGISNGYINVLLNLFLSTSLPLLFSIFCKRLHIHTLLFRPMNFIQQRKSS